MHVEFAVLDVSAVRVARVANSFPVALRHVAFENNFHAVASAWVRAFVHFFSPRSET